MTDAGVFKLQLFTLKQHLGGCLNSFQYDIVSKQCAVQMIFELASEENPIAIQKLN